MSRIIAFVAHKGGVGKTTCAQQVSAALAQRHGLRVLAIDLDAQSNLTRGLTREPIPADLTSSELLLDENRLVSDYIINVRRNLDLIPNRYLPEQDQALAQRGDRWKSLRPRLHPVEQVYDYVIIDTPPAILYQTRSAIVTADQVILVMSCSQYSIIGATNIVSQVMELQLYSNRRHIPISVVINLYDDRRGLDHRIRADIERIFEEDVYQTAIRQNVRLGEAAQAASTIFEHDADCHGAQDFASLTREIIGQFAGQKRSSRAAADEAETPGRGKHKTIIIPIASGS
ncbi:MAG: ParA family protein [Blastocatellia bacterium]